MGRIINQEEWRFDQFKEEDEDEGVEIVVGEDGRVVAKKKLL